MTPRFTAASALAVALLAATACSKTAETDAGKEAPPATAGMDDASPGTASHPGAQPAQPTAPPASGDRADSYTDSGETGAPDR